MSEGRYCVRKEKEGEERGGEGGEGRRSGGG